MTQSNMVFYTLAVGSSVSYHQEAQLSVISLYAYSDPETVIVVYTDHPEYYCWLEGGRIQIRTMPQDQLQGWINGGPGKNPYFFRAKLCLAADIASAYSCASIWFDTDCVAVSHLSGLQERLEQGVALMQKSEDRFSDGDTKAERAYWKALKGSDFAGIRATKESRQWNSGIIGVPAGQASRAMKALQTLDAMMAAEIPGRTLEQVAAGLALEESGPLEACDQVIYHYWANKAQWHDFALTLLFQALNIKADIDQVAGKYRELVENHKLPPLRAERPSRVERHKRRWRKRLRLLAPCEK